MPSTYNTGQGKAEGVEGSEDKELGERELPQVVKNRFDILIDSPNIGESSKVDLRYWRSRIEYYTKTLPALFLDKE